MELPGIEDLLVLLPGAGTTFVVACLGMLLWRGSKRPDFGGMALAFVGVAVGAGLLVTWWRTHDGLPAFDGAATERAVWAALAFGVAGSVAHLLVRRFTPKLLPGTLQRFLEYWFAIAAVCFVLRTLLERDPSQAGALGIVPALLIGSALALYVFLAEFSVESESPSYSVLALSLTCGAAGQLALMFGSGSLGQLAGTIAIAIGASAALAWLVARRKLGAPHALRILHSRATMAIGLLAIVAWFFSERPPKISVIFLGIAPFAGYAMRVPALRRRPGLGGVIVVTLALACCAIAVYCGYDALPEPEDDPYSEFK